MHTITPQEFDNTKIRETPNVTRPRGNNRGQKNIYKDVICAFDIETSNINLGDEKTPNYQAFPYVWQFQFGLETPTIIGRDFYEELPLFLERICEYLEEDEYLVVYVHNLSFEFQFLRGIYKFQPEESFVMKHRSILKANMYSHIEFRCSYKLTNMSLAQYLKKMGVENQKSDAEKFDYHEIRYPWSELPKDKIEYAVNDVLGLVQGITKEMNINNDTLYTIPLTSTGYVRRDVKNAMRRVHPGIVRRQLPDIELHRLLREAFRGGNTHANRRRVGRIIENVKSSDFSSDYPGVMCNCKYPMSKFWKAKTFEVDDVIKSVFKRGRACITRMSLLKPRIKDDNCGCPYLSVDKCRNLKNPLVDNGRILECEYLETTITDLDLRIILDMYEFDDITFFDTQYARYGSLPEPIISCCIDYYVKKTELKDVEGQEVYYTKNKNLLNSIYGMMVQNPVKQNILYNGEIGEYYEEYKDEGEILEKKNKNAFLCYQWGVWTTAWARYRLHEVNVIVKDDHVYNDTDCVKHTGDYDFTDYNKLRIQESKKSGAYAKDKYGNTHYMGVLESEGSCEKFITWGAKKYAMEKDGETIITVAGVNKKRGAVELIEDGGLEAFKPGYIFRKGGGTEARYNDNVSIDLEVEGRLLKIRTNVAILDSTYKLGLSAEYLRLLTTIDRRVTG